MNEPTLPTQNEIAALPRWAQVAFAARCARRVLPLFKEYWPDAPARHVQAIANAVSVAENASARAGDCRGTAAALATAAHAASTASNATDVASATARAAAAAAATAAAAAFARTTHATASEAASHAARAAAGTDTIISAIRSDFDALVLIAREEMWDNDTPVAREFFEPRTHDKPTPLQSAPEVQFPTHAISDQSQVAPDDELPYADLWAPEEQWKLTITVPGVWSTRPAVPGAWSIRPIPDLTAKWVQVALTPGEIVFRTDRVYLFRVNETVTDQQLEGIRVLSDVTSFGALDLSGCTKLTNAGLKELATLKNLTHLNLRDCTVSDTDLRELEPLKTLSTLCLNGTQVTGAGVKEFQKALPKCLIIK